MCVGPTTALFHFRFSFLCEVYFPNIQLPFHINLFGNMRHEAAQAMCVCVCVYVYACLVGARMWCVQILISLFFSFLNFIPLHLHLVFSFSFLFQYFVYLFICVFEIFIWQIFHIKYTKKLSWEVVISTNYTANLCIKVVWDFFLITCT